MRVNLRENRTTAQARPVSAHNRSALLVYYIGLALISLAGVGYGYFFSELFFADSHPEWLRMLMTVLKWSWIIPLPYAVVNYFSFIRYPVYQKPRLPAAAKRLGCRLYFRIVTRGLNPNLVAETVRQARCVLEGVLANDQWRIEVVTDHPLTVATADGQVQSLLVPSNYRPPAGALYKARALHYALGASQANDEDWIIHLDEETGFDEATVRAISHFVAEEGEQPATHRRVGQGVVLYGRTRIVNWLTTLADSLRVGDDYGRFRLQFEYGKAYFGMHGSFIVINNAVARSVGFDHGAVGSITEDAYLALLLQARGYQFKFIHAFMYERSPFSIADFIRQRRRWFGGLWLCVLTPTLPLRDRLILGTFMLMWSTCWLSITMVYVNLFIPTGTPVWLGIIGGLSFSYYVLLYLVGYFATFYGQLPRQEFAWHLVEQVALIPFFSMMEGAGALYGLALPPKDFYIVQKEVSPQHRPLPPVAVRPSGLALWRLSVGRRVLAIIEKGALRLQAVRWQVASHDAMGVYTADFWLRALQWRSARSSWDGLQVTCVGFQVSGVEQLQALYGSAVRDQALAQIAATLTSSFRAYDLVCRYGGQNFAVALLRCPAQVGDVAAQRVATRLVQQTLDQINRSYGIHLALCWKTAPLPHEGLEKTQIASMVEQLFGAANLAASGGVG
jgi:egghead protein (zeste-white 4 protein)